MADTPTKSISDDFNYDTFYSRLYAEIPEFALFDLTDNFDDGDVLYYLLMGDFTRFVYDVCRKYLANSKDSTEWKHLLERCLDLMERAINSLDKRLEELIWLGFVENLTPSYAEDVEVYQTIKGMLGPKLCNVLTSYFDQDD